MKAYWKPIVENIYKMTVLLLQAKKVVELGTGPGVSSVAFCEALKQTNGVLYSIDLHLENCRHTVEKLQARFNNFGFIPGDSVEVGKNWDKGNIDILLCDSDHSYETVMNELETWKITNPKIIFIHDTFLKGEYLDPYNAAKDFAEKYRKHFFNFEWENGLGVIV